MLLLLHLFGHSVQWVAPSQAQLNDLQNTQDKTRFMRCCTTTSSKRPIRAGSHTSVAPGLDQWYKLCTGWQYVNVPSNRSHSTMDGLYRQRRCHSTGADSAAEAAAGGGPVRVLKIRRKRNPRPLRRSLRSCIAS